MALEDRVNALEEELKVLKNQVQATLLEIQEQILMHYYPSLRGELAPPPGTAWKAQRSAQDQGNGRQSPAEIESPLPPEDLQRIFTLDDDQFVEGEASSPTSARTPESELSRQPDPRDLAPMPQAGSESIDWLEDDVTDEEDLTGEPLDLPDMRQVSLDELRTLLAKKLDEEQPALKAREPVEAISTQPSVPKITKTVDTKERLPAADPLAQHQHPPDAQMPNLAEAFARPKGELAPRAQGMNSWTGFGDLMAWVSESVEKIGVDSTRTATEIYARAGHVDVGLQGIIFQLISQYPAQETEKEATTGEIVSALKGLNVVLARASADGERTARSVEAGLG